MESAEVPAPHAVGEVHRPSPMNGIPSSPDEARQDAPKHGAISTGRGVAGACSGPHRMARGGDRGGGAIPGQGCAEGPGRGKGPNRANSIEPTLRGVGAGCSHPMPSSSGAAGSSSQAGSPPEGSSSSQADGDFSRSARRPSGRSSRRSPYGGRSLASPGDWSSRGDLGPRPGDRGACAGLRAHASSPRIEPSSGFGSPGRTGWADSGGAV
jgi:hypothetical protein